MRGSLLFVAGLLVGAAVHTAVAQSAVQQPVVRLNHVALSVPSVQDALTWYGDRMGFHEVFRTTNQQGQLMSAYIQISRDTFIELQQANAQRPAGINHFGLELADIKAAVSTWRQRGVMVTDPNGPSPVSGGILANVTDLNGLRIELTEQPPEGKLRKATESWKGSAF